MELEAFIILSEVTRLDGITQADFVEGRELNCTPKMVKKITFIFCIFYHNKKKPHKCNKRRFKGDSFREWVKEEEPVQETKQEKLKR